MTDEELQAIKQRADAATPGPWHSFTMSGYFFTISGLDGANGYGSAPGVASTIECSARQDENAEFIAHAREDIPHLLQYIDTLRCVIDNLRRESSDSKQDRT